MTVWAVTVWLRWSMQEWHRGLSRKPDSARRVERSRHGNLEVLRTTACRVSIEAVSTWMRKSGLPVVTVIVWVVLVVVAAVTFWGSAVLVLMMMYMLMRVRVFIGGRRWTR